MNNIIQKIIDNKDEIVGLRFNGGFYDVDYVSVDNVDCYDQLANDDVIIKAHTIDVVSGDGVMAFEFTVSELKAERDIKLYKLEEL